jgi:hypothetical protein
MHLFIISWNIMFPLHLGLCWGLFPSDVRLQLFAATCPAYPIYGLIILITFGGWYKITNIEHEEILNIKSLPVLFFLVMIWLFLL